MSNADKPRAAKAKAAPKKAATPTTSRKSRKAEKEPEPETEEEDEDEVVEERSAEEEEDDEPKTASEVSEEVVAPETEVEVDESESIRMDSSETNALEGVIVAVVGRVNKERIFDIVVKNGGVAHKEPKLTKKINYLVVDDPKKEKYQKAKKLGIEIVPEQWIDQFE